LVQIKKESSDLQSAKITELYPLCPGKGKKARQSRVTTGSSQWPPPGTLQTEEENIEPKQDYYEGMGNSTRDKKGGGTTSGVNMGPQQSRKLVNLQVPLQSQLTEKKLGENNRGGGTQVSGLWGLRV